MTGGIMRACLLEREIDWGGWEGGADVHYFFVS